MYIGPKGSKDPESKDGKESDDIDSDSSINYIADEEAFDDKDPYFEVRRGHI